MKTREDFVSNSSSCSFVIKKPVGCVRALAKKLKMTVDDIVADLNSSDSQSLADMSVYIFKDDDSFDSKSMRFYEFMRDYQDYQFGEQSIVEFMCDDYEEDRKQMLRLLYNAFQKCGYEVDEEDSEHEFLYENENSKVITNLMRL